jgi:hypothetical protein
MKLSDKNFIELFKLFVGDNWEASSRIITEIFERKGDYNIRESDVVLPSGAWKELLKIAQSEDPYYDPQYDPTDDEGAYVELMFDKGVFYFGVAGDKTAYDYDEDEDVDCIGDFEINIYTREVDFGVRCDT